MVHHKKKTIFGNIYSIKKLNKFRILIDDYFKMTKSSGDEKEITFHRAEINKMLLCIENIVSEANVSLYVLGFPGEGYVPELGPSVGEKVSVLQYIFHLYMYHIPEQEVLDIIDKAIGVYSDDKITSIVRTLNPIFYSIRFLDFIFNTPFNLLKKLVLTHKK